MEVWEPGGLLPVRPPSGRSRDGRRIGLATPQHNQDCDVTLPDTVELDLGLSLLSKELLSG
jgi:hypothetical protein